MSRQMWIHKHPIAHPQQFAMLHCATVSRKRKSPMEGDDDDPDMSNMDTTYSSDEESPNAHISHALNMRIKELEDEIKALELKHGIRFFQ
jgi:hypothetical protein